jgi:hypothetical protein
MLYNMSWYGYCSSYTSLFNSVTYFSAVLFVMMIHNMLLGVLKTHSAQQGSVVVEWSWNMHMMNSSILLTCNSWASTAAWGYMLRYPGHRLPNTNVFHQLEQRLCETGSVPPHMWMQVAHGLYRHQPLEIPQLQLWNNSLGEAHVMPHENWDYPNRGPSLRSTTFMPLHAERTSVSRWSSSMDAILQVAWHQHTVDELFLCNILRTDKTYFMCEGVFNVHQSPLGTG